MLQSRLKTGIIGSFWDRTESVLVNLVYFRIFCPKSPHCVRVTFSFLPLLQVWIRLMSQLIVPGGVRGQLVIGHRITGTSLKVTGCTVHKFINSPVATGTLRSPVGSGVELASDLASPLPHHYIIRRFPSELLSRSTFPQDSREL